MIIGGSIDCGTHMYDMYCTIHTNEITHREKNITEGHTHVGLYVQTVRLCRVDEK